MLVKELFLNVHILGLFWSESIHQADNNELVGIGHEASDIL